MTIDQLIAAKRSEIAAKLAERAANVKELAQLREKTEPTDADQARVDELRSANAAIDSAVNDLEVKVADYEAERAADAAADARSITITPAAASPSERRAPVVVTSEERTYHQGNDPQGKAFLRDLAGEFVGRDRTATERLNRHMAEERVERGASLTEYEKRAPTTSNFAGLVIPQYLTDLFAPQAKAGRPFADLCRHHDLPTDGMTVSLGKMTTGSSVDVQAAQGDTVSETDVDDTLVTVNVQTNAGSQSLPRQAIERGVGIEDVTLDDLFRAYATSLDTKLLNQSANGLTNVATNISYTDGTPTVAELYPKLLAAPAAVEAALLDMDQADLVAVMHSRRWYWLNSGLTSTWPLLGQPGIAAQAAGVNYAERYGNGFRGLLPNGIPVVVDNNVATNLGSGTNEDEIYFVSKSEVHLWEDPNAPMFIKAEQSQVKKLLVDFVVYGFFAYTHVRRAHAQKISGTGLVTPSF